MQIISVNNQYSSALRRFAAWFIDRLVLSIILSFILRRFFDLDFTFDEDAFGFGFFHWSIWGWYGVVKEVIIIAYFSLMESSKYRATIGKIALGIIVVDRHNEQLSFAKALLRNLSKIISAAIIGIGYIMILFDERKQGLHDKIAETFVLKQ
jgi:uncharacterized RDD family membrane protein YckC